MAPVVRGSELSGLSKIVTTLQETPTGGAYRYHYYYQENFQPGEGLVDDILIGGPRHNLVDPTKQAPDLPAPTGTDQRPFCINGIGDLLAMMWGAPVTDDAGDPVFEHVFTSGGTTFQARTLEFPGIGTNVVKIVDYAGVSQMSLAMAKEGGFKKIDATYMMRSVRRVTAPLHASTAAARVLAQAPAYKGLCKINSVNFGNILGGSITMANGMLFERYMDDTKWPSAVEIGTPSFSASPEIRFRSDGKAVLDLFDATTPFALELLWQLSADSLVKIECPNVIAQPVLPAGAGPGMMSVTPNFMAYQTEDDPMLKITLRNAVESYAS